ncbi:Uncharacterised protein [Mycobacteroides abscessus subsp. abscessus]|nr:Uncharacterised protein [Mycobacteroides abscessus subsp. abscessus]
MLTRLSDNILPRAVPCAMRPARYTIGSSHLLAQ